MTTLLFNVNFEFLNDIFKTFFLCSALGIYIRFLMSVVSDQKWIKNFSGQHCNSTFKLVKL